MTEIPALDDADRAAVMVMLLDDDQAASLLARLDPDELELLGARISALREIDQHAVRQSVASFFAQTERPRFGPRDPAQRVQTLMVDALGELKARGVIDRFASPRKASSIELVRWLAPQAIAPLIAGEHPQAIAVLLVQLEPDSAAQVLAALPADVQGEVVVRVATLDAVPPDALQMLETLLDRRLAERGAGGAAMAMGGPGDAAAIINSAGGEIEKRVLPLLARYDKALARRIEEERFKFEHLFALDPMGIGALLREVDSDTLIDALKGTAPENRECFFRAMSSRAADGVRDEIEGRGRLKMEEALAAQRAVVAIARRLAAEGTIQFGPSGGESDFV